MYQRWFTYDDDIRVWKDVLKFMDKHGWIDEATTEVVMSKAVHANANHPLLIRPFFCHQVETVMILYSPRIDAFSVNKVTFEINTEGKISGRVSTNTVKLSGPRLTSHIKFFDGSHEYDYFQVSWPWSLLPIIMASWLVTCILKILWEIMALSSKATIEQICPDDP